MNPVVTLIITLFTLGAVLIAFLAPAATRSQLWRLYGLQFVLIGAWLIPPLIEPPWFLGLLTLAAGRMAYEYIRVLDVSIEWMLPPVLLIPLLVESGLSWWMFAMWLFAMGLVVFTDKRWFALAGMLPLAGVLAFYQVDLVAGFLVIVWAYAVVEAHDAFALVSGKLWGKTPLLPRLSPGKTWEGLLGGVVIGGLSGWGVAVWILQWDHSTALLASLWVMTWGWTGDMAASAMKRQLSIKDYPSVLREHGGLLDIYDAALAGVFGVALILPWLPNTQNV